MKKFDVFGIRIGVARRDGVWRPYLLGNEGKFRDAPFAIPHDLQEPELAHYLAVMYHEHATPERNEVKAL
jgi:hypothetical protein